MKYKGFTYTPAPKTAWDTLSMLEKSEMMKVAVRNGITDLKTIREKYNEFAGGGDTNDGMTGMMKAKLATAAHFGNPTARRMTNYDTRSFIWPGEYEYDRGIGEPKRGNVFVGSYGNLVTPQIQDTGNDLSFIDNVWSPENDQRSYLQSLKFDNENDARYFGEHYKEIAPMMNLYSMGGHRIHIKPENRGKFTALKERTGHSATWFKEHGTPAQKKMATFALNSRHWKHGLGGNLFYRTSEPTQQMNVMAYHPVEDYFTGPSATMPEINVTRKRNGKTYVGLGDFSKRYDRQKEQPYFVSSRTGQLSAGDAMKGIDAATGPLLHWAQPSQYVGAVRDAVEGKNPLTSMLRGNSGVVSEGYAQEYPVVSTLLNLGTDLAVPVTANSNLLRESGKFGMPMGVPNGLTRTVYAIATRKPMPLPMKQAAAKRMKEFIHSEDYISRQKNAGLSDEAISDFQNMVERRLNDGNFPAYYSNIKSNGRSLVLPKPLGGVYIRKGIQPDDFLNVLDHEVAHYSTVNFTKGENKLHEWINKENPAVVEDMMKHNEAITPYRPESDVVNIRRARGLDADANWLMVPENRRRLEYFRNEQELRSNGYAMIQEAQRRGITVDDLVDQYTMQSTGEIFGHAPKPLRYMNYAYTPDQIKSFLKGLLSLSIPVALNTKNKDDQENNKFH